MGTCLAPSCHVIAQGGLFLVGLGDRTVCVDTSDPLGLDLALSVGAVGMVGLKNRERREREEPLHAGMCSAFAVGGC
jgi:hypothetical protein